MPHPTPPPPARTPEHIPHTFQPNHTRRSIFDTDNIDIGPERRNYLDHQLSRVWEYNDEVARGFVWRGGGCGVQRVVGWVAKGQGRCGIRGWGSVRNRVIMWMPFCVQVCMVGWKGDSWAVHFAWAAGGSILNHLAMALSGQPTASCAALRIRSASNKNFPNNLYHCLSRAQGSIPYVPYLRAPYYVWIGRIPKLETLLVENKARLRVWEGGRVRSGWGVPTQHCCYGHYSMARSR